MVLNGDVSGLNPTVPLNLLADLLNGLGRTNSLFVLVVLDHEGYCCKCMCNFKE